MAFQDVVIHTAEGAASLPTRLGQSAPPIKNRFDFDGELWIGKLDHSVAEMVFESCDPPGHWLRKPARQFGQLYAFVRDFADQGDMYNWDPDSRLRECVALSRLVHPTSISFRYAARMVYGADGEVREMIPGPVTGHGANAYVAAENHRDWLVEVELGTL